MPRLERRQRRAAAAYAAGLEMIDIAERDDGGLQLRAYNFVVPLEEGGAPVTSAPDKPAGAK